MTGNTQQKDIHLNIINSTTCEEIEEFIEKYKFPVLKKLESNYIKFLQQHKRKILVAAINGKNNTHLKFLKEIFIVVAERYSLGLVNVYIDFEEDKQLFSHFKINDAKFPKIIIFDFEKLRYYVDPQPYSSESYQLLYLNDLLAKYQQGEIKLKSGNFFEDLLERLGIELSPTGMTILCIVLFVVIFSLVILLIYYCEGNETDAEVITHNAYEEKNKKEGKTEAKKQEKEENSNSNPIEDKKNR